MTVEFKADGWYSLLTDRGDTSLIGRKTDGKPILPIGGGCDRTSFCKKIRATGDVLPEIIERVSRKKLNPRSKTQQIIYREQVQRGRVKFKNRHALIDIFA